MALSRDKKAVVFAVLCTQLLLNAGLAFSTTTSAALAVSLSSVARRRASARRRRLIQRHIRDDLRRAQRIAGVPTAYRGPWATSEYAQKALGEPTPGVSPPDGMTEAEFNRKFRMGKQTFVHIHAALQLPVRIVTSNRLSMASDVALLLFLYRHGQKMTNFTTAQEFNVSESTSGRIIAAVRCNIYQLWFGALLFDRYRLNRVRLNTFARVIRSKGSVLLNIIGFIDGTRLKISKPRNYLLRWAIHNLKYGHNMAYLNVIGPDGLFMHFDGPYPGKDHDSKAYRQSTLEHIMDCFAPGFAVFGDSAYGLSHNLITIIKNAVSAAQKHFNKKMASLRVSVEWGFGGVENKNQYVKDPDNMVIGKGGFAVTVSVLVLLTNLVWCCERSQTSYYFGLLPPSPTQYLHSNLPKTPSDYKDANGVCICPDSVKRMWADADAVLRRADGDSVP